MSAKEEQFDGAQMLADIATMQIALAFKINEWLSRPETGKAMADVANYLDDFSRRFSKAIEKNLGSQ